MCKKDSVKHKTFKLFLPSRERKHMERNSEYYKKVISDSNIYSISCGHNINVTNHNHCQLSVTY